MTTDKDMVEVLEKRNRGGRYDLIISQCEVGMYHDFKSALATPKMILAEVLSNYPELADVKNDVISGKYDEGPND